MPKAAYYYLARAFRPVTVIISDEGLNGLDIHVVNETSQQIAPLLMISLLNGSVQTGETARRLLVAAHSTTRLSADDLIGTFTDISYAYRFGPAGHDTVVATLLDPDSGALLAQAFHFPTGLAAPRATARLSARVERVNERSHAVFVSTDELALAVSIDAPGWLISDNYFNIAPNSERRIVVTATRDGTVLAGRISALNSDSRLSLRGS
jgi:beta-mannosidase